MDFAGTLDGVPFAGGEGRDQMIELGSGRLVPGFEEQLEGAVGGEDRTVTVTFPDDYGSARPRRPATPSSRSPSARSRPSSCPALDDELAEEAGFDTLDELREDIRSRMAEAETSRIEAEFREAALDAAVAAATVEVPDALVEARARELWESMLHPLSHQGINRETYLRISGAPRRRRSRRPSRTPSRRCAARRCSPRSSRPSRSSRPRTSCSRRSARRRLPARRSRRRSCSSACSPTAAWTASRTIWRSARRWTCWRSRRSRFRSPSSRNPDRDRRFTTWPNDPGLTDPCPLLVFARVVRHGPSAI